MLQRPCECLHSPEFSFITVNYQQQSQTSSQHSHQKYTIKNVKYDIIVNDLYAIYGVWTAILHGLDCIGNINAWYLYYLCYWYLWILCLLVVYGKINIDNTWKIFIIHHINIRNR
eukprot:76709_1